MPRKPTELTGMSDLAEVVEVADHVERACEPGERARDRHRTDEVLLHVDAAVRGGLGVEADRTHLVPGGRPVEDEIEDDERGERDEEPDVQALELLLAPEDRQLRGVGDVVRDGSVLSAEFCSGPPSPKSHEPTQIATQLSMIVEITSWAPTVAFRNPAIPAQIAPGERRRADREQDVRKRVHPGESEPTQLAT